MLKKYLLKGLLLLAIVGGALFFWNRYIDSVEERGETRERARWMARELEQAGKYANRVNELTARNRELEHKGTLGLNQLGDEYELKLAALEQRRRDDVLSATTRRLRDPGAAPCPAPGGGARSAASAPAPSGDGAPGGYLSTTLTGLLLSIVNDADQVTEQLAAAQAVILEDRRICNGS